MSKHLIGALLLCVALAGCNGAISDRRAKLATAQPTTNTATATPSPENIQTTPPQPAEVGQPASVATGIEGGPWLDTFVTVGVWLLFVAMCGGVVFLFASTTGRMFTKRMDTQRTAELFTHGGNDQ